MILPKPREGVQLPLYPLVPPALSDSVGVGTWQKVTMKLLWENVKPTKKGAKTLQTDGKECKKMFTERLDLNLLAILKLLAKATSTGSLVEYNPLAALVPLLDSVKVWKIIPNVDPNHLTPG